MKILVTGSSGMIGSALVPELIKKGHTVFCVDIQHANYHTENTYRLDLRQPIKNLFNGNIDLIIHLAANARVYDLVLDPQLALDNITMIHNILEFARKTSVRKVLFASSREVYGNDQRLPVPEYLGSQRDTESPYAASKVAGESYCHAYRNSYGIDTRIMRFSNVYGRFDTSDRFIPLAIRTLKENKEFKIYGINKELDFTYLDDCVEGIITLIDQWDFLKWKEYNIASGKSAKLIDVAYSLQDLLKSTSEIKIEGSRTGEVVSYQADIGRMRELGWSPQIALSAGLTRSIEYYNAS